MSNLVPKSPLRLACIIDTLVTGGAERLVITFAETIKTVPNVELTVIVLNAEETPFRARLDSQGINVVTVPGRSLVDPGRFLRLLKVLRANKIEYIHAHLTSSITLGAFAAFLLRIPFVGTIHNVKSSAMRVSKARRALYAAAMRLPITRLIAVGKAVDDAVRREGFKGDCIVVPNAVAASDIADEDSRQTTRQDLGLADNETAIVCVGKIIHQKAHDVLLDTFATVLGRNPDCVLLIVGDGDPDLAQKLRAQAETLGITAKVKFLGMRSDIPNILAASDIFVSSSDFEGAPVSLLEAMMNGLPPVMTNVGENELVLEGTGAIIVPPRRPDELAEGLLSMMSDATLRDQVSTAVKIRAKGTYGAEAWVDRLLAYYATTGKRSDWHKQEVHA